MAGQRVCTDTPPPSGSDGATSGRRRRPGGGRRRDPAIDRRIVAAAREIYLEKGWAGFNFVTVARAAGASRDALYRRYDTPEQLLNAVLTDENSIALDLPLNGDPGEAIEELALSNYDYFTVGDGYIAMRVHVEAHQFPEVYAAYQKHVLDPGMDELTRSFAALFARNSIDTGSFDVRALVETITGTAMMHALLNQATNEDTGRAARARELIKVQVKQILSVTGLGIA